MQNPLIEVIAHWNCEWLEERLTSRIPKLRNEQIARPRLMVLAIFIGTLD
jgi:hypothetical protein